MDGGGAEGLRLTPPPMNAPNSERPTLMPVADLLGAATLLCLRHAQPLIVTATAGALVGVGFGALATPQTLPGVVVWSIFINALVAGLQAPVWMFVSFAQDGPIVEHESLLAYSVGVQVGLQRLGLPYFLLGLIVGSWVAWPAIATELVRPAIAAEFVPLVALVWLPPLAYALIRFSLAGPSIARGTSSPFRALAHSWELVRGRWWRTLGAQLPVFALSGLLLIGAGALETATGSRALGALATGLALGVSAPLIAAVSMALFLDYFNANYPPLRPPAQEPTTTEPPGEDDAGTEEPS